MELNSKSNSEEISKMKTYTISEFMNKQPEVKINKKLIVQTSLTACALYFGLEDTVFASTGIDAAGYTIYGKLVNIGKWIIIVKGALDTITNVVQGDYMSARKSFLSYLLTYLVLQGLPWAMNQVDVVFKDLNA